MDKCIYKSDESNICHRTTSENRGKVVCDKDCRICPLHQSVPTVSDRAKLQNLTVRVKNLLNVLSDDPNDYVDMGSFRQVKSAMKKIQEVL